MRLRLTRPAIRQLDRILAYIQERHPQGARNVEARLHSVMMLLETHPHAGRSTNRQGVRRMTANPYPYAITYRLSDDEVVILSVRHTARRPMA